jgi:gamma-glutamylcysteine synthetase
MAVSNYQPQFTQGDIQKLVMRQAERMCKAVLSRLQRIGEQFIADARNDGSYMDQTGNLRSSIGYVILENGVQIELAGFDTVKEGKEGAARGKALVEEIAGKYPVGYVLIVVAGMEYAAAVEAKGYDVLTMSSIKAGTDLKKAMQKLGAKA